MRAFLVFLVIGCALYGVYSAFAPHDILLERFPIPRTPWTIDIATEKTWAFVGPSTQFQKHVRAVNGRTHETVELMRISELYDVYLSYEEPRKLIITVEKELMPEVTKGQDSFGDISVVYRQVPYDVDFMRECQYVLAHKGESPDKEKSCDKTPYNGKGL